MKSDRYVVLLACRILAGSVAAFGSFLSGNSTCAANVFGLCYGAYLPFEPMQLGITLLAASLLAPALKDVFLRMERIELLERDVESIAGPFDHNPGSKFDLYDT